MERYFVGFFADRPIHGVMEADVHRYREWRKDYWTAGPGKDVRIIPYMRGGRQIRRPVTDKMRRPPSPSALRSEFVVLRLLFRFAAQQGYINTAQIPEIHLTRVPPNARPSFEAHEFTRLDQVSHERMADPKINDHVRRDRAVLHAYCMIAAFSGCRPTVRHFHISQQLIAGVDVFLLAKNTGTSSDMIERFYGQVKLERMAGELRPEWRTGPACGEG